MTAVTRTNLYQFFMAGDKPTAGQFADLIDSTLNIADVSGQFIKSDVSCGGTFETSGAFVVKNQASATFTGNVDIVGNITVSGNTNFISNISTAGNLSIGGSAAIASNLSVNASGNANLTGNLAVTGPSTLTGGIVGTSTNVATGNVGEIISSTATDASVSLVTSTDKTVTSIVLQAGNYDISGVVRFTADAATTFTTIEAILSVTQDAPGNTPEITSLNCTFTTGSSVVIPTPIVPLVVAASTNYFLNAYCTFAVSGMSVGGSLMARRVI